MVKDKYIGLRFSHTLPNGFKLYSVITQDPSKYEFYKSCGFDYIFEKTEEDDIKEQLTDMGVTFRSNSSITTLRKKLADAISERLSEHNQTDGNGEDND